MNVCRRHSLPPQHLCPLHKDLILGSLPFLTVGESCSWSSQGWPSSWTLRTYNRHVSKHAFNDHSSVSVEQSQIAAKTAVIQPLEFLLPGEARGYIAGWGQAPVEGVRGQVLAAVRQKLVVLQEALPLGDDLGAIAAILQNTDIISLPNSATRPLTKLKAAPSSPQEGANP